MSAMQALSQDDPRMVAWAAFIQTEEYKNAHKWATALNYDDGRPIRPDAIAAHVDGSLWAAFLRGWTNRGAAPAQGSAEPLSPGEIKHCQEIAAKIEIVEHPPTFPQEAVELFDRLVTLKYNENGRWRVQVELADGTKAIIGVNNIQDGELARVQIRGIALQLLGHWLKRPAAPAAPPEGEGEKP